MKTNDSLAIAFLLDPYDDNLLDFRHLASRTEGTGCVHEQ